jgi:hypothetical protein
MVRVLERLWMMLFISYKKYFSISMHNSVLGPKVVTHELQKMASPTNRGMHPYVSCKFTLWFEGTNEQQSI